MSTGQNYGNGMGRKVVKKMAALARSIAKDSLENRCWLLVHQPEEPKDLAKRMYEIQNNQRTIG